MAASYFVPASKYTFISEPDDSFKCLICLEVAGEPRQHEECGRLFCKKCLDLLGKDKPCPNCNRDNPSFFKDIKSNRDIQNLRVKCNGGDCSWEGTFGELENHNIASCKYALVPCPKKCMDDACKIQLVQRNDLDKHLETLCPNRQFTCPDCEKKGTFASITGTHAEVCERKKMPCPNEECMEILERQSIKRHLDDCDYTVIPCKYARLGCTTSMKRKSMKSHEEDEDKAHLNMALRQVISREEVIDSDGFIFKLPEFSKKKELEVPFTSSPHYTSIPGYHFYIKVYAGGCGDEKGTHLSLFFCVIEGRYDKELKWPFVGSIPVTLLNQLEDKNHHTRTIPVRIQSDVKVGKNWGFSEFISLSKLEHNASEQTQYLKDNTLYFRVKVEVEDRKPWLQCTPYTS